MPEEFQDGEILTAERLNAMRQSLEQAIGSHDHTGGANGAKLGNASLQTDSVGNAQLQDHSVSEAKLDPALFSLLKDGPSTAAFFSLPEKRFTRVVRTAETKSLASGTPGILAAEQPIPILREERFEWDVKGANIASAYRIPSDLDPLSRPSVIHIDFINAYREATYTVMLTPEWRRGVAPLVVYSRGTSSVELAVPTGEYEDLFLNFSMVIFGELEL